MDTLQTQIFFHGKTQILPYLYDPPMLFMFRVPNLMLILAGIYLTIQMLACLMMTEPPPASSASIPTISTSVEDEIERQKVGVKSSGSGSNISDLLDDENNLTPLEALKTKEFYILWLTRFSVVLVTQTVAGFYKVISIF